MLWRSALRTDSLPVPPVPGVPHNSFRSPCSLHSNKMRQACCRSVLRTPPRTLRASAPQKSPALACRLSLNNPCLHSEQAKTPPQHQQRAGRAGCGANEERRGAQGMWRRARARLTHPRDSAINPLARRVCPSATSECESSELCGAPHARAPQRSRRSRPLLLSAAACPPRPLPTTHVSTRTPGFPPSRE